ncbi:MBL fold metallo-hydrolase [Sporolactobacillus terrae]|uniref:Metallo-hydrolase n=1 Tax=Sporolactobacillus terrae TaxID=269673 RepID=A0A410DCY2_9BACL|nr:MBL fold metallo-hydrolase [Sporolactobacillus terrae]QAA23883.1 MBL fold metallo-hydrolase [Sporolactobacillus terrae]QAA26854.1 MBL fold metallo-hydrolase [Sporolactobacillus terrae]UAK15913.1 MBL fold metallo-hydrolase [Sporolactobacillus terrae]BBO00421.1 metallo-hydrolase [Sporolactobacillus terrae]
MPFKFSVLASGSTGNSLYIETEQRRLLIDCGLSGKKMVELLGQIDRRPEDIDAILVTHEHSDHIKGLGVFARRFHTPVYANQKTWRAMSSGIGEIPTEQKFDFEANTTQDFNDLSVESFSVSHDAADPMFFVVHQGEKQLTLATDLGYVSTHIKGLIHNSDAYVMEANHDTEMLMMGRYPWSVKRRILGDTGHISNEESGVALTEVFGDHTKRIYLAHLSKDNNMKELARMSVGQHLERLGLKLGREIGLYDTDPDHSTKLTAV